MPRLRTDLMRHGLALLARGESLLLRNNMWRKRKLVLVLSGAKLESRKRLLTLWNRPSCQTGGSSKLMLCGC